MFLIRVRMIGIQMHLLSLSPPHIVLVETIPSEQWTSPGKPGHYRTVAMPMASARDQNPLSTIAQNSSGSCQQSGESTSINNVCGGVVSILPRFKKSPSIVVFYRRCGCMVRIKGKINRSFNTTDDNRTIIMIIVS